MQWEFVGRSTEGDSSDPMGWPRRQQEVPLSLAEALYSSTCSLVPSYKTEKYIDQELQDAEHRADLEPLEPTSTGFTPKITGCLLGSLVAPGTLGSLIVQFFHLEDPLS